MPYLYFYLLEVNNKRSCVKGHLFPHQFKRLKSKYQSMSLHLPSLTVLIPFPSFSHMHSPSSHFELPLHVPCPAATLTCPLPHSHPYMSPAHSHPYTSSNIYVCVLQMFVPISCDFLFLFFFFFWGGGGGGGFNEEKRRSHTYILNSLSHELVSVFKIKVLHIHKYVQQRK